jgi:ribosomal protein L35
MAGREAKVGFLCFDRQGNPAILIDPAWRAARRALSSQSTETQVFVMGKFKPHKGLLKRVRVTKNGKVKGRKANGSHLRSPKPASQLRTFGKAHYFTSYGVRKRMSKLLGFRVKAAHVSPERAAEVEKENAAKAAARKD